MPRSSKWSLPFRLFDKRILNIFHLFDAYSTTCPAHILLDLIIAKKHLARIQIVELLIMQFSTASYDFIPLWSKYSPKHPVLFPSMSSGNYMSQLPQVSNAVFYMFITVNRDYFLKHH
jgi:hypothetical protein